MRNVISISTSADVSEEYAEQVERLIAVQPAQRETTQVNQWGQTDYHVRLHTYEAPGSGETMWAVDYSDPAIRELEETGSREEADARYEELVRDSAENLGIDDDGFQERFAVTDVDGVPGPLPELPDVDAEQVDDLLDEEGAPVLYLALDDDGDPVLRIGQADETDSTVTVLTRLQVLDELNLSDGDGRVTAEYAAREVHDFAMQTSYIAHAQTASVRRAAELLFTVPAA
ncbi:hypothetical protein TPA0906_00310 [Streptomyces olivaceus]|uniref:hypothetical protein n=1 Tax=Streptomyces olivaceus TaxID=47716 RepID=UPI0022EEA6C5|nr:hypothetical protein [Streptomyces olivaceus]GHI98165.1 hypothetical protein TPA0906_00310 [Streptomyces olivaceus]